MPYVETRDGTRLFYKDWGMASGPQAASGPRATSGSQAGKPVLFLHGWPLDADMWDYQMLPLADARMIEYAGAPHGLFLTERTRLAADLRRFLEEP